MSGAGDPVELDPFGYLVGTASRVPGLGGPTPWHDPTYVFHVPYVAVAPGPATFTITFDNLRAKHGTLTLRVHMLPDEAGGAVRLVNSLRIQLNRLVKDGGEIVIGFDGYRDVTYAVMGAISDATDIEADAIRVVLDRPADARALAESFAEARSTMFGSEEVVASAHMISSDPPTMRMPVSQPYGVTQMREPVTAAWHERLGLAAETGTSRWRVIYKLQAIESYGMMHAGARALGFARGDEAFVAALAANGIETVIADSDAERVVAAADPLYLPAALVNFDMLWASDPGAGLSDVAEVGRFVENAMACLRPGGLAVFVFETSPVTLDGDMAGGGVRLSRIDIERIALMLISRRNEVAQLKPIQISYGDGGDVFGMIARKPRTAL